MNNSSIISSSKNKNALHAPQHAITIKTTCAYCGVGCGVNAQVDTNKHVVKVNGDKDHPANFGKLCSKGSALGETLALSSRLLFPEIRGSRVSWDAALNNVARNFSRIVEEHGPDSVALYGSGQLLTEDYYVANKLMKGFIGTANIDTNSRLCMASAVAGHKRAFGSDTVPNIYEDFDHTDLLVITGSNTAWCHPVIFQRLREAKEKNPNLKVVVIDPRRTDTCDIADLYLPIAPGSDVALFNGLLTYLQEHDCLDHEYIHSHTNHFDEAIAAAKIDAPNTQAVVTRCNLDQEDVTTFFKWFSTTQKTLTLFSMGIKQSSSGVDKVNSILNAHLATGRIGKPGSGPFSLTGQPNAMGGREVGGLANQLAAHMDFKPADIERLSRFWQTKNLAVKPGLTAVELFTAIEKGTIKAVWIMATNPVVSLPNADQVKRALHKCELVVVSDCVNNTDTLDLAHVKLPAQGWSEKDGMVTNSERRISRQRRLLKPAGEAKPDWWIISQVAARMGFAEAFKYEHPVDIFREHAALSAFENNAEHTLRDFNIGALQDLTVDEYDQFEPTTWPIAHREISTRETKRFFSQGDFFTPDRKANFIALMTRHPENLPDAMYPFILNTGRLRDQWHTMTRTGLAARLNQHKPEPFIDIHPKNADQLALEQGELVKVSSRWGKIIVRVNVSDSQRLGEVFVPMHWTNQFASCGRMGAVVNPAVDPISRQPESKHTPVALEKFSPLMHGFIISRKKIHTSLSEYTVEIPGDEFYRYEIAQDIQIEEFDRFCDQTIRDYCQELDVYNEGKYESQTVKYTDERSGIMRRAFIHEGRIEFVIFLAKSIHQTQLPQRNYVSSLFGNNAELITDSERLTLLSGLPPIGIEDTGATVCACFNIGEKTIMRAITEHELHTHKEIGEKCKAGTNCGSCVPEIKKILRATLS